MRAWLDYKTAYEKQASFYLARPWSVKLLKLLNLLFTGVFIVAYGVLLYLAFKKNYPPLAQTKIIALPACTLLSVPPLRMLFCRLRPYDEKGANITPLLVKKHKDNDSFPSRHLASAFVLCFAFVAYLPPLSAIFFPIALGLGYIRFALGLHYPTDLLGGMVLGSIFGIFFLI